MNIITGYRGEAHITSAQDRAKNQGSFGTGSYILDVGDQLAAEVVSANEVRIRDGVLCMQGCVASIDEGAYDSCEISNGTQGMQRRDLIVARYTRDSETNIEDISLVVIEGTPASSSPSDPTYNTGDIQAGDSPVDFPLYRVNVSGITIASTTKLASNVKTQAELQSDNNTLKDNIDYFALGSDAGVDTITTTQVPHTLYGSRKFSDYKFICAIIEDTYRRTFTMVPSYIFQTSVLPVSLSYVDSGGTQYWAELRYVSDTSYSLVGSANASGKKMRVYGLIKK